MSGAFSYSRLSLAEQCMLAYKLRYIDKKPVLTSAALSDGSKIHETIEKYLKYVQSQRLKEYDYDVFREMSRSVVLSDGASVWQILSRLNMQTVLPIEAINYTGIELKLAVESRWMPVDYLSKDGFFRGVVDAMVYDPATKTIVITDWKSSRKMSASEDQLKAYAALADSNFSNKFDVDRYKVRFVYLRLGAVEEQEFSPLECQWFKDDLTVRITEVQKAKSFEPSLNQWCPWCEVRKFCPKYQEAVEAGMLSDLTPDDAVDAAEKFVMLKTAADDYKTIVKTLVEEEGNVKLPNGTEVGLITKSRRSVDNKKFVNWLRQHPEVDPYKVLYRASFRADILAEFNLNPEEYTKTNTYTALGIGTSEEDDDE